MLEYADSAADDEAIIEYIVSNPDAFSDDNRTGKRILNEYWSEITGNWDAGIDGLAKKYHYLFTDDVGQDKLKGFQSTDFALDMMIYGFKGGTRSSDIKKPKEVFTLHEIVTLFPDVDSITNTKSSYALRKNLILVFFFWYWTNALFAKKEKRLSPAVGFDGFVDQMNAILNECGYYSLYYGNPYDWIFLYCAKCWDPENYWNYNNPVEVFHGITSTDDDQ